MTHKIAVFIYGDSRLDENALKFFSNFIDRMRSRATEYQIEAGICGSASLGVEKALTTLVAHDARTIVCVPAILFGAAHDIQNIPVEIIKFASNNPQIDMLYARDLVVDGRLLIAARDQIAECQTHGADIADEDTLLMVVGSESDNPVANSNVAKAARLLWECMGFGWAETSYCGDTRPSVSTGMAHALKLGFKRIIVFPGFLFANDTVRQIYDAAHALEKENPAVEILYAPQITDHPMVLESLMDRINEALKGSNTMNCMLCDYREQIVGHEPHAHNTEHAHTHSHSGDHHSHDHDHTKHD